MQQWEFQEFVSIRTHQNDQILQSQQLEQQQIQQTQCQLHNIGNDMVLGFKRQMLIRISTLIELNKKGIVQISPKKILEIIHLCLSSLQFCQNEMIISENVELTDIWLKFEESEKVFVTKLRSESQSIISNGHIRYLILSIWRELFYQQHWSQQQNPVYLVFVQIASGVNLEFISNQIQILQTTNQVQTEDENYKMKQESKIQFEFIIHAIKNLEFSLIQSSHEVTEQFKALIINELILNQSHFVHQVYQNKKCPVFHSNLKQLLITQLQLRVILCFFRFKSADILISENILNLQELTQYCLEEKSSILQPIKSINQAEREPLIASLDEESFCKILKDLNIERQKKNHQNVISAYKTKIKEYILNKINHQELTEQFKNEIVESSLQSQSITVLDTQFHKQITSQNSLLPQLNTQILIDQYIQSHMQQIVQAIKQAKQDSVDQVLQQLGLNE